MEKLRQHLIAGLTVQNAPSKSRQLGLISNRKTFLKRDVPDSLSFWNSNVANSASRAIATGQSAGSRSSTPVNGSFVDSPEKRLRLASERRGNRLVPDQSRSDCSATQPVAR